MMMKNLRSMITAREFFEHFKPISKSDINDDDSDDHENADDEKPAEHDNSLANGKEKGGW